MYTMCAFNDFRYHHLVLDNKLGDFTYIFPWDGNILPKSLRIHPLCWLCCVVVDQKAPKI